MKDNLKKLALSFVLVLLACILAFCIALGAVVTEPHTYKKAARNEAYLQGIQDAVAEELQKAAAGTGLPEELLRKHASKKQIRKMAERNAADAALVLSGKQAIYSVTFDENALLLDMEKYYREEMGVPARDARQEALEKAAADIRSAVNTATRVVDMEKLAYNMSGGMLALLQLASGASILFVLLGFAIVLLALYRLTGRQTLARWLWGVCLCAGISMLMPAALILITGRYDLDLQPVQLALLGETMIQGILTVCILLALFWFAAAIVALRSAQGKPMQFRKLLTALERRLGRKHQERGHDHGGEAAAAETAATGSARESANGTPADTTEPADGAPANAAEATGEAGKDAPKTAEDTPSAAGFTKENLLQNARKAAVDSLNTILWRKR